MKRLVICSGDVLEIATKIVNSIEYNDPEVMLEAIEGALSEPFYLQPESTTRIEVEQWPRENT